MQTLRQGLDALRNWFGLKTTADDADVRETRFFFVIVTLILGGMAALAVKSLPALRAPARLIPFVILMLVHIALYWVSPNFMASPGRIVGYLSVQAVLVFILTLFPRDISIILSLYPALLGIAVGMLREKRRVILAVLIWLGLVTLNLVLTLGTETLPTWLLFAPPLTLFVVIYVELYMRQVEARDRAQALLRELETAHRDLADRAARIEELTLAAERQRMARELHDTLAQGVAGLILQLEAVDSHLAAGREERAQEIVRQAMGHARATLADARQAIGDLRAEPPASPNLSAALRKEAERFTTATGIPCVLDLMLPASVRGEMGEPIVRIVSEGLTNVARHAQAQHVWLRGTEMAGWLVIEVRDDGVGFDPAAVAGAGHYGLSGMRERARLAGGTLEVVSAPGNGTRLTLRLPL